jgi:hypothetical protein
MSAFTQMGLAMRFGSCPPPLVGAVTADELWRGPP